MLQDDTMAELAQQTLDTREVLKLDPYNPRLRLAEEGKSQDELIAIMLARFKVEEVGESIVSAGWLNQDPLIAVEEDGEKRIVEGNRRLTAVKLLLNPELAPDNRRNRWRALSSAVRPETREAIKSLNVRLFESRDDPEVSSYIGFRHVTGVLPWPALEKASYIARLAGRGLSYRDLAQKLGSYPSHVRRHHVAFQLVEQAQDWEIDGAAQMGNAFGVLLRSLQTEGVVTFLGIDPSDNTRENLRPVPTGRKEQFQQFIEWTFGTEEKKKILPESRELTNWSKILLSPDAVRYLELTPEPRFAKAWSLSGGEGESLADSLWKASYLLADAVPLVSEHRSEEAILDAARACERFMAQISKTLTADEVTPRA
jgi:ParB-like chromosome segregation protein Spo0J